MAQVFEGEWTFLTPVLRPLERGLYGIDDLKVLPLDPKQLAPPFLRSERLLFAAWPRGGGKR
jgi:hypothetical protein